MRIYKAIGWACCLCGLPGLSMASSLVDVYQQALQSDPSYQIDVSTYRVAREQVPISQAKLLPDVGLTGTFNHSRTYKKDPDSHSNTETGVFALSLSQALFNAADSRALQSAKASVRAAKAQYDAADQALIMRVAKAYFAVLEAHDMWLYSQSQSRSLAKQMQQTQQRFDVGLDAITAVQEVRAQYDAALASQLAAANGLTNVLEDLRAMTGQKYQFLASLPADRLPLVSPSPADLQAWVRQAEKNNDTIKAARASAEAAQETLLAAEAGHLPVVSATGAYTYTRNTDTTLSAVQATHVPTVGMRVAMPVYSGGAISATARKAAYSAALAESTAVQTTRAVLNQTRQAYLGVLAGISQVQATRQTVRSSMSTLRSTSEAYQVGTRTLTDVLAAQANLYAAQQGYAQQQYAYLLSMLGLKQAAGSLQEKDLSEIGQWFGAQIEVKAYYQPILLTEIKAAYGVDAGYRGSAVPQQKPALIELPVPRFGGAAGTAGAVSVPVPEAKL